MRGVAEAVVAFLGAGASARAGVAGRWDGLGAAGVAGRSAAVGRAGIAGRSAAV